MTPHRILRGVVEVEAQPTRAPRPRAFRHGRETRTRTHGRERRARRPLTHSHTRTPAQAPFPIRDGEGHAAQTQAATHGLPRSERCEADASAVTGARRHRRQTAQVPGGCERLPCSHPPSRAGPTACHAVDAFERVHPISCHEMGFDLVKRRVSHRPLPAIGPIPQRHAGGGGQTLTASQILTTVAATAAWFSQRRGGLKERGRGGRGGGGGRKEESDLPAGRSRPLDSHP